MVLGSCWLMVCLFVSSQLNSSARGASSRLIISFPLETDSISWSDISSILYTSDVEDEGDVFFLLFPFLLDSFAEVQGDWFSVRWSVLQWQVSCPKVQCRSTGLRWIQLEAGLNSGTVCSCGASMACGPLCSDVQPRLGSSS